MTDAAKEQEIEEKKDDSGEFPALIKIEQIGDEEDNLPPPPPRQKWGSKLAFFLTLLGYAVGFGNIWRFPYQVRENGGLAFMIPYTLMLAVMGIPIFFLELSVGQRRRKGPIYAWNELSPALGGIGISCGWLCFMVGLYYNTLIAYCVSYFIDSFINPLPWTNCKTATSRKDELMECEGPLEGKSTKYYWHRKTLDMSEEFGQPGNYSWYLFLYLVLVWVAIFAILFKGTKSVGAVVYVTAVFPYVVLVAFFIGNLCIEPGKAWLGAYRLVKPDWSYLIKPLTWLKAGSQIFFSLSLADGCLVVYASFCKERNNCYKDAIHISLINCGTSIFAAMVVFPMIGSLGFRKYEECFKLMQTVFPKALTNGMLSKNYDIYFFTNATTWEEVSQAKPITIRFGYGEISGEDKPNYLGHDASSDDLLTRITLQDEIGDKTVFNVTDLIDCSIGEQATSSGGGTGFVFMAFTEAVKSMPGSNFWSVLFFIMLLMLGIDSGFGNVEGVITAVEDLTHMKRLHVTILVCGVMMFFTLLIFPFGWGVYVLDLLDQWTANWTLLVIALLECYAVAWVYGLAKIAYDVRLMTGSKPNLYILICWKYIAPACIILILIGTVAEFIYSTVQSGGIKYNVFQPKHPDSVDGIREVQMPALALVVGFFLMIFCIMWVPIHCLLKNTKYKLLRPQAEAEFPEKELREHQNIQVEREEDQFTKTEKVIMGMHSLTSLQLHRDLTKSKTSLRSRTSSIGSKR